MFQILLLPLLLGSAQAGGSRYLTTVTPLPNEDIAQPCRYELMIADPEHPIRAVWVVFERGRDLLKIYNHLEVSRLVSRNRLALMMPFHCAEKPGQENDQPGHEMDMEPKNGLGRALFTALDQFARSSGHPELASSKLIFLGFSGTGSLVARMVGFAPDRVVASISTAPGHWEPLGMDTVELPSNALAVPQLIIANSEDKVCGTHRPYQYFQKYSGLGAPMAFVLQNGVGHCCIVNSEGLITSWVEEVLREREPGRSTELKQMQRNGGWHLFIKVQETSTKDSWGQSTWQASDASIQRKTGPAPQGYISAGWMPTGKLARRWLRFVRESHHSAVSLP